MPQPLQLVAEILPFCWERMMTIENAVKRIRAVSAGQTNKSAPISNPLVADLCDALWAAGQYPQIKLLVENLPHLHQRAVTPGFHAWRKAQNLHLHYPRWANPFIGGAAALAAMVSPEIAQALLTVFDPANDGRWPAPRPRVVAYGGIPRTASSRGYCNWKKNESDRPSGKTRCVRKSSDCIRPPAKEEAINERWSDQLPASQAGSDRTGSCSLRRATA